MKNFLPFIAISSPQVLAAFFFLLICMPRVYSSHAGGSSHTMATLLHKHRHPGGLGRHHVGRNHQNRESVPDFDVEERRVHTGPNPLHN